MKHGGKMLLLLAGGMAWSAANAVTTDSALNPYQTIVDRNVFALKPPPPPPSEEEKKQPPLKITLTGITTILGNKRALMKAPAPPSKPGEPAKPELSFILTEGQRDGEVEVLEIDEKAGNVKINNGGVVVTLNIDKDGQKLPAAPAPMPGALGIPSATGGIPAPVPGGIHTPAGAPASHPGFTMPTRTLRLPPANSGVPISGGNPMFNPTPIRQANQYNAQPQQPAASLEQQILKMELEREANKSNPNFPPLPPTPLTPNSGGTETTPGQSGPPSLPTLPRPSGMPPVPH